MSKTVINKNERYLEYVIKHIEENITNINKEVIKQYILSW